MTRSPLSPHVRAARTAVSTVFLVNGAALATWVSRIPAIKRDLGLSDGVLGLALLSMAAGALFAFSVTGYLIARYGSRRVTVAAGLLFCAALPLLAVAPSLALLVLTLALFGALNGAMDVAMNAHGVEVEARYGRPILSSFHGMFSLGGLIGAGIGALVAGAGITTEVHFAAAAVLLEAALLLVALRLLPTPPAHRPGDSVFALPSRSLLGFGIIAFCASMTEGSMADWSAVYLRDTLGTGAGYAAAGYAAFSLTMTAVRFGGDALVARLGPVFMVRWGGLVAAVGLGSALLLGHPAATLLGFACVGIGMATLYPLVFSAAGRTPGVTSGTAIAAVATMGYSGFLAGPPFIGLLAEGISLRGALGLVALLCLLIALLSPIVRRAERAPEREAPALEV
ncbi:MFS family permease [Deinobacterium chartae]|uniref:MFS family permease n=1 Tax=Deinobacterium chartae TaxID=521158 RepID=A0A841HX45_9DEIO|nr:MFS family permease [Deinobacterium chartae]